MLQESMNEKGRRKKVWGLETMGNAKHGRRKKQKTQSIYREEITLRKTSKRRWEDGDEEEARQMPK